MDRQALELINKELELKWGKIFRLVFADEQFETRHRIHTLFDNSGNYLGEHEETARLPKYSHCRGCVVLEKYVVGARVPKEVKDWNGWEIIWNFVDEATNRPQTPNLAVCMFITSSLMEGVKKTVQDFADEERARFDAEVEQTYDMLENESPYIATMLKNREAIVVPEIKKDK